VRVWCSQGFDGGVAQRFALEAYDSAVVDGGPSVGFDDDSGGPAVAADGSAPLMLTNMTADRPDFTLRSLSPSAGLRLAVYAYNSRGTSERTWLTAYTLNSADKQTTSGTYYYYPSAEMNRRKYPLHSSVRSYRVTFPTGIGNLTSQVTVVVVVIIIITLRFTEAKNVLCRDAFPVFGVFRLPT